MAWFTDYRRRLLKKIYEGSPYGGSDKFAGLWPLLLGGAIFMAADLGFGLQDPFRLIILAALGAPGAIWLAYVTFHDFKALRRWYGQRSGPRKEDE